MENGTLNPFVSRIVRAHQRKFRETPTSVVIWTAPGQEPNPAWFEADSWNHQSTRTRWSATPKQVRHTYDVPHDPEWQTQSKQGHRVFVSGV